MVIIVMFWRTFGNIVFIYINGNALKSLSLLGKNQRLEHSSINAINSSNIFPFNTLQYFLQTAHIYCRKRIKIEFEIHTLRCEQVKVPPLAQ